MMLDWWCLPALCSPPERIVLTLRVIVWVEASSEDHSVEEEEEEEEGPTDRRPEHTHQEEQKCVMLISRLILNINYS